MIFHYLRTQEDSQGHTAKKGKKKYSQEDGANNKIFFISSVSNQQAKPHGATSIYINTSDNSIQDFKIYFYVNSHVDKLFGK
jgi:hypothetical protein